MVSGTFNSPKRGAFHRSLTLLCTIGYRGVLSLGGWAPQLHTRFHGSRATLVHQERQIIVKYGTFTLYGLTFQTVLLIIYLVTLIHGARNPNEQAHWFGLYPLSLAATYGVSVDFLSCRYLDVSVLCVGFYGLCIQPQMIAIGCPTLTGCPIRRSRD